MDDLILTGTHGKWQWIVVREMIRDLPLLTTQHHVGHRLCITAFDSGPISPTSDEAAIGWILMGDVMISPPLTESTDVPCGEYDEWYVFPTVPPRCDFRNRFVNYVGFTLADPKRLVPTMDQERDRTHLDWLVQLQTEFWHELERLGPLSYVASGDYDIIVTTNLRFAECVLAAAQEMPG